MSDDQFYNLQDIFTRMTRTNEDVQTLVLKAYNENIPICYIFDDSFTIQLNHQIDISKQRTGFEIEFRDWQHQTNNLVDLSRTYKVSFEDLQNNILSILQEVDSDYEELREFSDELDNDLRKENVLDCSSFVSGKRTIELLDKTYTINIGKGADFDEIQFITPRTDEFKENVRQFQFVYKLRSSEVKFGKRSPRKLTWENAFSTHAVGLMPTFDELMQKMIAVLTKFYDKKNLW